MTAGDGGGRADPPGADRSSPMPAERWERLQALFEEALALDPAARAAFIEAASPDDPALRDRLRALLAHHREPAEVLTRSVALTAAAVTAPRHPVRDNERVGPYRIVRELARGGMGAVYLAERADASFQKRVALKIVALAPGRALIERFQGERQILATLEHPNIARLLDGGTSDDGLPYVVMEYVEGAPLDRYAEANRLSVDDRLALVATLCDAVSHAHRSLIVHRDLKPANILVDADGAPKLLDFGIAKLLEPGRGPAGVEATGPATRILTPSYASPEQIRGEPVGTGSDVYSLGVVLYELLTGRLPFDAGTGSAAPDRPGTPPLPSVAAIATPDAARIAEKRRTTPRALSRRLSGDVDTIVMCALRHDVARRYASAQALGEDIRNTLEGHPINARPPTRRYRASKFIRRNRFAVAGGVLLIAGLVTAAVVSTTFAIRAERARAVAEVERRNADRYARIAEATTTFLNEDVLSAVSPGELGVDATLREALDAASGRIQGRFTDEPLVEASIRRTLGSTFVSLGEYKLAEPHTRRALELYERELGPDDPESAVAMLALASLHLYAGRHVEAETLAVEGERILRRTRGADDADRLEAVSALGAAYALLSRHDEGERRLLAAIQRADGVLGSEHDVTLALRNNLAFLYSHAGRWAESLAMRRDVADVLRRSHGNEHPLTLSALNNLVTAYLRSGREDSSLVLATELHATRVRVLGESHPGTLVSLVNMARIHVVAAEYAKAESLGQIALEASERVLGPLHRHTKAAMAVVASALSGEGRFVEAEAVQQREVALCRQDTNMLATARALERLGETLARLGRLDAAEAAFVEAYDALEAVEAAPLWDELGVFLDRLRAAGHGERAARVSDRAVVLDARSR